MPWSCSVPAGGGPVGQIGQELPGGRRHPVDLVGEPDGGVEQLAVDVELALVPGAVADPHRGAVPPAAEVLQLPLGEIALAADAEHDLQVPAPPDLGRRRRRQVVEELVGLVGAGRHPQGLHGEAGVADPGVAVVPVAGPARRLGQGGRRRGDDRPGGEVGEGVEHAAAVMNQIAPRPLVALVDGRPGAPRLGGVGQAVGDLLCAPQLGRCLRRAQMVESERHGLARDHRELARPTNSSISTGTGLERASTSAPPRATTPPSTGWRKGVTRPYSGRGA